MKKLSKTAKKTRAKRVAKARGNLKNVATKEAIKWVSDKMNGNNIFK